MLELNPLDVLNIRQLETIPPHFCKTKIDGNGRNYKDIVNWIRSKLTGRYCIATYPSVTNNDKFQTSTFVGFEEQKELTFFMLACPYLRRN
jgi:hypothetical protein